MFRTITDYFFQPANNQPAQNQPAPTFRERIVAIQLQDLPFPHEFQCPVSFELMNDPSVLTSEHDAVNCVDRASLENCNGTHPLTRAKFSNNQIVRHQDMFKKIEDFVVQLERIYRKESYIQGWKNEIAALNFETYKQLPALRNIADEQLQLMFVDAQIELQKNLDAVVIRQYLDLSDYIEFMKTSFTDQHDRDLRENIRIYEQKLNDLCDSFPHLLQEQKPEEHVQEEREVHVDHNLQQQADVAVVQFGVFHHPEQNHAQAAQQQVGPHSTIGLNLSTE